MRGEWEAKSCGADFFGTGAKDARQKMSEFLTGTSFHFLEKKIKNADLPPRIENQNPYRVLSGFYRGFVRNFR